MNKKIILLIFLVNIFLLSSCSIGGSKTAMLNKENDDKKADARLDQVIEAIQNQDKEALRSMFSKQALDEAQDLDGSMDYLFKLFQGEVKSKKRDGLLASETINYGHNTKEVKSAYTVETDKQKYIFFFLECTEDTDNPDNVGLYTLRVIKAEDKDKEYGLSWQDKKIAGIYRPDESNDNGVTASPT